MFFVNTHMRFCSVVRLNSSPAQAEEAYDIESAHTARLQRSNG
jgi:hypothetical protein